MLCHLMVLGARVASLQTRGTRRSFAAVFLAAVFGLLGLADVAAAANVGPVSGTVVDPAGKPAAGAKVWLLMADTYFASAADAGRIDHRRKGPLSTARCQVGAFESERGPAHACSPRRPGTRRRGGDRDFVVCERPSAVDHEDRARRGEGIRGAHDRRRRQTDCQGVGRAAVARGRPVAAGRFLNPHVARRTRERTNG